MLQISNLNEMKIIDLQNNLTRLVQSLIVIVIVNFKN